MGGAPQESAAHMRGLQSGRNSRDQTRPDITLYGGPSPCCRARFKAAAQARVQEPGSPPRACRKTGRISAPSCFCAFALHLRPIQCIPRVRLCDLLHDLTSANPRGARFEQSRSARPSPDKPASSMALQHLPKSQERLPRRVGRRPPRRRSIVSAVTRSSLFVNLDTRNLA